MTTTTTPVTPRQREILAWAAEYIGAHGFSPSLRELCRAFNFKSPNGAMCHLLPLRKKGMLTWVENAPRTMRLTPEGEEVLRGN
jgi:repressor LexA